MRRKGEHEKIRRLDLTCRAASSHHKLTHISAKDCLPACPSFITRNITYTLNNNNASPLVWSTVILPISPLPSEAVLWQRRRDHKQTARLSAKVHRPPAQARRLILTATEKRARADSGPLMPPLPIPILQHILLRFPTTGTTCPTQQHGVTLAARPISGPWSPTRRPCCHHQDNLPQTHS